jgi:hypothetical protein
MRITTMIVLTAPDGVEQAIAAVPRKDWPQL